MKKLLMCISFLLVIAMLSACQANNVENSNSSSNEIEKNAEQPTDAKKEPVKYVMYAAFSAGAGENSSIDAERPDIEIKPSAEKNFNITTREYVNELSNDPTNTKKFKVAGKTYEVAYLRSYNTPLSSSAKFNKVGKLSQYYSSAEKITIEAIDETNEIVLFMDSNVNRRAEGDLSKAQAEAKAKEIFESIYGSESLKNYSFEISLVETQNEKYYKAEYSRYVYGLKTEDNLSLKINMEGKLASFTALKRGTMNNAEQDLTKEEIDNAIKAVNEKFSASWTVSNDHYIVIDSNGDYYLRTNIARSLDKSPPAMEIHTNIQ